MQILTHLTFIPIAVGSMVVGPVLLVLVIVLPMLCRRYRGHSLYPWLRRLAAVGFVLAAIVCLLGLPGLVSIVWNRNNFWPIPWTFTLLGYATYLCAALVVTLPFVLVRPTSAMRDEHVRSSWMFLMLFGLVLFDVATIAVPAGILAWDYPPHARQASELEGQETFANYWRSVGATAETRDGTSRGRLRSIDWGRLTAQRLKPLDDVRELESLELQGIGVGDRDLEHVVHLTNLKALNLGQTKITDRGLAQLASLPNLEILRLRGTAITDAGLEHIRGLRKLRELDLQQTRISDLSIPMLMELPMLDMICVGETEMSPNAISALREKFGESHVTNNRLSP